jgi:phosphoserine phosphatase RsbU/P
MEVTKFQGFSVRVVATGPCFSRGRPKSVEGQGTLYGGRKARETCDMSGLRSMTDRSPTSPKPRGLRPVLFALAVVFAAATILYSALWMLAVSWAPGVELGFDNTPSMLVTDVHKNSPAEKAGLLPGDRILAIDVTRLESASSLYKLYKPHKPGDTVQLTVERHGQTSPVVLTAVFRRRPSHREEGGWTGSFAELLRNSYPVPFVVVGLVVLFLRLEDRRVWHLALLFASCTPGPGISGGFADVPAALWPFGIAYQVLAQGMAAPLFYSFFAVFPVRSPLDRRLPWLKWVSLVSLPIAILSLVRPQLRVGGLRLLALPNLFGEPSQMQTILMCCIVEFVALGVASLASNFFGATDPEARRKIRVIFWGTAIALAPALADIATHFFVDFQDPDWLATALVANLFLFPLSFGYAVVKHRVLEIPVLLKRSARYFFVQRGFTVFLALLSIAVTLLFASLFTRYLRPLMEVAQPAGIALGVVFGTLLLWGGSQLHKRVSTRIDRAFFRSAYDARVILEDLAEKTSAATDGSELAHLLEHHLKEALQPSTLAVYFQGSEGSLTAASGQVPRELRTIHANLPILAELARRGQPWEFPPAAEEAAEKSGVSLLHPECLVPVMGRGGRLVGLLVLGPRLSEGPCSGEDKRLLASIAGQAGTALENMRFAGEIADRIEADRLVARELEIAKEVQARLLPQEPPRLETLDCAGKCIEARSVGGDYYDYLDLGPDHVGFVLADVSGKGVHAALLTANLQAYLRSQSGIAPLDPTRLLQQANRMLLKGTASQHFATLFFGIYDDSSRDLTYVNCGHNAPVLLRQDGSVERLPATATVIGMFEGWKCEVERIRLAPGDLLVIFSDGVTEAAHDEEEYGEARLIHELQACRYLSASEIVETIFSSVQEFSAGAQSDDLTLVIAKVHS